MYFEYIHPTPLIPYIQNLRLIFSPSPLNLVHVGPGNLGIDPALPCGEPIHGYVIKKFKIDPSPRSYQLLLFIYKTLCLAASISSLYLMCTYNYR